MLKVGATQFKLGAAEREFIASAAANVLTPLKRFLEGDMKTIAVSRPGLYASQNAINELSWISERTKDSYK